MYSEATVYANTILATLTNVATYPLGESLPSNETSVVLNSVGAVQLTLPTLSGSAIPSGWKIYRSNSSGTETYLTTIPGFQKFFYDDGSYTATSTTSAPTSASGIGNYLSNSLTGLSSITASSWIGQQQTQYSTTETVAYNQTIAQPFVPNNNYLQSIDLALNVHGAPTGNVILSIYPAGVNNGNPTYPLTSGNSIGQVTLSTSAVQDFINLGNYTKFSFSSPVSLTVGALYHIVVTLDTPANTIASNNYIQWAQVTNSQTLVTPVINTYCYTNQTSLSTATWSNQPGYYGCAYRINATGELPAGTYYYTVTAVSGWSLVQQISRVDINSKPFYGNVIFSSGLNGLDNIYVILQNNTATYESVNVWLVEKYDLTTHLWLSVSNGQYGNTNTQTDINGSPLNTYYYTINADTAAVANNYNITYRMHVHIDNLFISISGENSGSSSWVLQGAFVGKLASSNALDKCYILSATNSNYAAWSQLRDANGNVNTFLHPMFPVYSVIGGGGNAFSNTGPSNTVPFLNNFTSSNDAIYMWMLDTTNGVRGYVPNILLYNANSGQSTNTIPANTALIVNGNQYKFYYLNNKWICSNYFAIGGYVVEDVYYPLVNMN